MTPWLTDVALLAVSILLLWQGAARLVDSAARIGRALHMSGLTIGLTIVAFGTSAPEFAVTVGAALQGQSDISVGNIVGSNIFNLGIILGGCAAIRALKTSAPLIYRDGLLLISTTFVLAFMLHDLHLSQLEGLILLTGFFGYVLLLFIRQQHLEEEIPIGTCTWKDYPLALVGIGAVVGGGHLLVTSAADLARVWGVSEWVIAVTVVAAGTSAPELATSLMAAVKGRHGMLLGNLIGSDLFNFLGVLGLASTMRALSLAPASLHSIYLLVSVCVLTCCLLRTGWRLVRWEGIVLILLGLFRWGFDVLG
jgi:cation:H+ antiporter